MKKWMALALALLLCGKAGAKTPGKYVALTFDDGPSGERTVALLEGLAERKVHATFFVCGSQAENQPDVMQAVAEAGHEIGLHTCDHIYMHKMTKEASLQELQQCADKIEAACGKRPKLFRPPGGLCGDGVLQAAEQLDLPIILWSVDPEDWNPRAQKQVLPTLLQDTKPGSILLMHELSDHSVQCALKAVDRLRQQGYEFCTVSDLAEKAGADLLGGQIYRCFS